MVVLGDVNAKVGNEVIEGIVGQNTVPGRNGSGKQLLEMFAEQKLVMGNSWFKKMDVLKYMWVRMVVDKALIVCVVTKMNAWKTVRCDSVERKRRRNV